MGQKNHVAEQIINLRNMLVQNFVEIIVCYLALS